MSSFVSRFGRSALRSLAPPGRSFFHGNPTGLRVRGAGAGSTHPAPGSPDLRSFRVPSPIPNAEEPTSKGQPTSRSPETGSPYGRRWAGRAVSLWLAIQILAPGIRYGLRLIRSGLPGIGKRV